MKAYKVFYKTGSSSGSTILLVGKNETIEEALSKKDTDFSTDSRWCKIGYTREIPLSTVLISDLSITEFQTMMNN